MGLNSNHFLVDMHKISKLKGNINFADQTI